MEEAIQSSVYVASPDYAGWLMKRGFHWRKKWKRRWIALHGAEIIYMDDEPGPENINSLKITKAKINPNSEVQNEDIEGNPNGFCLHINDGQVPTWCLRADTVRDKKAWIVRLNYIIAILKWLESFEKIRVLGVGGTGIVYELLHKSNGIRYALKEIEIKNQKQREMAISEAGMLKDIMENISHPNILHIEKVFQVGSKFYLLFPLCTGGELYEHIVQRGHFTEYDAARITYDLISGLYALHKNGVLHLDIKPENLLFENNDENAVIKITDFGISRIFSKQHLDESIQQTTTTTEFSYEKLKQKIIEYQKTKTINYQMIKGTIGYMSPELILLGYSSKAADIFAAGVVVYILLCGRPPFAGENDATVILRTVEGRYNTSNPRYLAISAEGKDLIEKMLALNPLDRITCEEILQHPWILQVSEGIETNPLSSTASVVATSEEVRSDPSTSPTVVSPASKLSSVPSSSRSATMKNDLGDTLKALSKHVTRMRSQKMATNLTRLMSYMRTGNSEKSFSLAERFLRPKNSNEITTAPEGISETTSTTTTTESSTNPTPGKTSRLTNFFRSGASSTTAPNPSSSSTSGKYSPPQPSTKVNSNSSQSDRDEELMILMNKDLRDALSRVLYRLNHTIPSYSSATTFSPGALGLASNASIDSTYSSTTTSTTAPAMAIPAMTYPEDDNNLTTDSKILGLSIEQFLVILHHFHFTPSGQTNINAAQRTNVAAILFCRFLDRDGDGFITLDDILTAQAMILQRSESFLKMLFRMYTESLWYPGRQINYMHLVKTFHTLIKDAVAPENPSPHPPSSTSNTSKETTTAAVPPTTPNNHHLVSGTDHNEDLVEPPKFITAKHVSAVFEKLGYEPAHGMTVFNILSATAYRIKTLELQNQKKQQALPQSLSGGASTASLMMGLGGGSVLSDEISRSSLIQEDQMRITNSDIQLAIHQHQQQQMRSVSTIKEETKLTLRELEELLESSQTMNIQNAKTGGAATGSMKAGGVSGSNHPIQVDVLLSVARSGGDVEDDDDEEAEGNIKSGSGSGPPTPSHVHHPSTASSTHTATTSTIASSGSAGSPPQGQIPAMMDISDFVRACRTDDILVQAILRKPRKHIKDLINRAREQAVASEGQFSVSYYLEKELIEAFQRSGININVTASTLPNTGGGGVSNSGTPQTTSQKLAAAGRATLSSMVGWTSKAMNWMSTSAIEEESDEEEPSKKARETGMNPLSQDRTASYPLLSGASPSLSYYTTVSGQYTQHDDDSLSSLSSFTLTTSVPSRI